MSSVKSRDSRRNFMNNILDDIYHPNQPICQIIPTKLQARKPDLFEQYRPHKGTCDDYHISQTDTRLDAGDTKIHVQQTEAEYYPFLAEAPPPPPVKEKKKISYGSGGPPCWEFLHEKYKRLMDEKQKIYREEFAKRVILRKKTEKETLMAKHRKVMNFVGPDWYQELSPKQFKVVDDLKNCIDKDYAEGVICHTVDNIAKLGLFLRPNHKHVEKALKNCCKCPVEFLLILYQLIDPKRKSYSINDRLLLSAVVHLTMRNTLRELHVRIPSPPPPQKKQRTKSKKKKRVEYESPYLEPYTFHREPPRFTGIYYNKHRQYPESPYFSYLNELKKCLKEINEEEEKIDLDTQIVSAADKEIKAETDLAQSIYEKLVDYRPVQRLLKPSRYGQCYNFRNKPIQIPFPYDSMPHSLEDEVVICICKKDQELRRKLKRQLARIGTGEEMATECEIGRKKKKKMLQIPIKKEKTMIIGGVKETTEGPVFLISGLQPETELEVCTCAKDFELLEQRRELVGSTATEEQKFILGGVVNTPQGPIFVLSGVQPEHHSKEDEERRREEFVQSMIRQKKKFVIEGVVNTREGPVFLLSRLQPGIEWGIEEENEERTKEYDTEEQLTPICGEKEFAATEEEVTEDQPQKKLCFCIEDRMEEEERKKSEKKSTEENEGEEEEEKSEEVSEICDCKTESRKFIDKPLCPCEKCTEERKRKTTKYVIQGMKETESVDVIPVIDSVVTEQPCACLKKYEKKVDDYEMYQKRKQLVLSTSEKKDKFIVGGVANTREGPVYIHCGLQPKLECPCAEKARREEAERRHLARMPRAPPGRIKYGIGGVKETPQGNVYIINNTLPSENCQCIRAYDHFTEEHKTCLKLYEDYLCQMKVEINEFINGTPERRQSSGLSQILNVTNYDSGSKWVDDSDERKETIVSEPKVEKIEEENEKDGFDDFDTTNACGDGCKKKILPPTCGCGKIECKECTCDGREVVVPCTDCTCGPPEQQEDEEEEAGEDVEEEEEEETLKRFFIYKKFRCNIRWQMDVLKRALKSMADDGYPLAKLPDCHKLPHFKLWMKMRCGKYWTLDDKYQSILVSKYWWRHVDSCTVRRLERPLLPITKQQGQALDWSKAPYVRKIVRNTLNSFYRCVRQNNVHKGREFFPTTFEYEFPFHTFRDCYFAYTPSKEEDVLAMFVWQKYDYNNMADSKHCSC